MTWRGVDYLEGINDPRRMAYGNIRHKLIDSIVIAFTATQCGYEDYEEMEEFGRLKRDFLKGFLELPAGMPDESTFRRVLHCLNPQEGLESWLVAVKGGGRGAAGNHRRGSGFHVVGTWIGEHGLVLGQLTMGEKSNAITAVPKLLDLVNVRDDVVTADAMSCQKEIAKKIREKGADLCVCSERESGGRFLEMARSTEATQPKLPYRGGFREQEGYGPG